MPEAIIMATGSEVHLAMKAAEIMAAEGRQIRVVSMPCAERFLAQSPEWKEQVLPAAVKKRLAIEAGSTACWYRFTGLEGAVIGLDSFGVSAPAEEAYQYFGISVDNIVKQVQSMLQSV